MKGNIALCALLALCSSQAILVSADLSAVEVDLKELIAIIRFTQDKLTEKSNEVRDYILPRIAVIENNILVNITHALNNELNAAKVKAEAAHNTNQLDAEKCYNLVEPLIKVLHASAETDIKELEANVDFALEDLMARFNESLTDGNEFVKEIGEISSNCDMFGSEKEVCVTSTVNELKVEVESYKNDSMSFINDVKQAVDDIFHDAHFDGLGQLAEIEKGIAGIDEKVISCLNKVQ